MEHAQETAQGILQCMDKHQHVFGVMTGLTRDAVCCHKVRLWFGLTLKPRRVKYVLENADQTVIAEVGKQIMHNFGHVTKYPNRVQ